MNKPENYFCNPTYIQKRDGDYEKATKITSKWEPVSSKDHDLIGNVRPTFSLETEKFTFSHEKFLPDYIGMYHVISSALLLYRLICLYKAEVYTEGPEGYKCIWWITLKHKETGEVLMFGEWKGAAGIWTRYHNSKELPASYKKDTLNLLNFLVSKTCPHPYDGLVAGSVA